MPPVEGVDQTWREIAHLFSSILSSLIVCLLLIKRLQNKSWQPRMQKYHVHFLLLPTNDDEVRVFAIVFARTLTNLQERFSKRDLVDSTSLRGHSDPYEHITPARTKICFAGVMSLEALRKFLEILLTLQLFLRDLRTFTEKSSR
jgi:hypothetical protein